MTAEGQLSPDEQRSLDAQRSRELSERGRPAEVTASFRPTHLPRMGSWNLFLCVLGVAIPGAIVVVNLM